MLTREDPAFGGPAAGIAAGLSKLAESAAPGSDFTIVVACDMPSVADAIRPLLQRLAGTDGDGVIAVDPDGRLQPLAAVYRTTKLAAAAGTARAAGTLDGLSTFQLIAGLRLVQVPVPPGATDDIDTWADAQRLGVAHPDTVEGAPTERHDSKIDTGKEKHIMSVEERSREGDDEALQEWSARLAKALGLDDFEVDLKTVLGLAGRAAHAVLRPAAPLTTYVVGYAAGLAAGSGSASSADAVKSATDVAFQLCREEMAATGGAPDSAGRGSHADQGQHPEP
jgi:hypothetical protein